ncbi:MbcA/ParS/Xre antitoxin family protein [Pseudoalteromonas sp. SG41-1]|uniref:MbcA/ParS/Xre antitoxin family protein n=1 Tax=Pseudoalteromonas sp. SG41-1 TaxID=2760979 RepID=UPI002872EC42|nr:MbcA/ParS/Xre antitoxin family protein [Pseudoalteromonas sp. SG41-1]
MLGIYKNLGILFSEKTQANEWLHKPNKAFDGVQALDYTSLGQTVHLRKVRHYLDAQLSF